MAADKTKDGLEQDRRVMTDEWITGRIHGRFVDEDLLKGSNISVHTASTWHLTGINGDRRPQPGHNRREGMEGVN